MAQPYSFQTQQTDKGVGIAVVIVTLTVVVLAVILFSKFFKVGNKITATAGEVAGNILDATGLTTDQNTKDNKSIVDSATKSAAANPSTSPWSPSYWQQYKANGALLFTQSTTDNLVNQLWDSVGYLWQKDNSAQAVAAIKQCKTKTQVSWLVDNFSKKHQLDLLTWMASHFDTAQQLFDLATITKYVDNLPNYKTK